MLPLERRIEALKQLLALERSTSNAIAYNEWENPPEIHFEIDDAETYYYTNINI
jgi:hypothetical protein